MASPLLLGEVTVTGIPASAAGPVHARLQQAAPRVKVIWPPRHLEGATASTAWIDSSNPLAIVRTYLGEQFKHDTDQRDRLTAAFELLLATDDTNEPEVSA